jgi:hypothetical protein
MALYNANTGYCCIFKAGYARHNGVVKNFMLGLPQTK